ISPVSTTTIRPSNSITIMFLPISPSPPKGSTRSFLLGTGNTHSLYRKEGCLAGDREADALEGGPHRGPLLLVGGDHRQPHARGSEAEHLEPGLDGDRVGGDGDPLV